MLARACRVGDGSESWSPRPSWAKHEVMMVDGAQGLVQKLRLQRGWSQEQLAEVSGLSVRTVQRLESGKPASTESLKAIASVFEIDFNRLKEPDMVTTRSPDIAQDEALALAHVRQVKKFYLHAIQYVAIVVCLAALNAFVTPQYPWVLWVVFGWGIGLAAHGLRVFQWAPFFDGAWERREVEKHLGRKL